MFVVEYNFRSYGNGRTDGPSVKEVTQLFHARFNRDPQANRIVLQLISKFLTAGSVLMQRAGYSDNKIS